MRNHRPLNPLPSEMSFEAFSKYHECFQENLKSITEPHTGIVTRAHPYPNGIVLKVELKPYGKTESYFFDMNPTITEAFHEADIHIDNYLTETQHKAFYNPATDKNRFFSGTNILYSENFIHLIKSSEKDNWSERSAQRDVKRIQHDLKSLSHA